MAVAEILPRGEPDDRFLSARTFEDPEIDAAERRLEMLARALDTAFRIPGTGIRFGADTLVGFIPGIGEIVTQGLSLWIVSEAWRLGASKRLIARMVGNVAVDTVIGVVPLVGDVADMFFRANTRNITLLREHIARVRSERARPVDITPRSPR